MVSADWVRVTPDMISGSKTDGVKVTVSMDDNGGVRINNDALQGGCGRGAGSAATTFITGPWTNIMYTQEFDGHASCWGIFGDRGYHYGAAHSNLHDMNQASSDFIYDVVDMSDVKSADKNRRCDNAGSNFWHAASGRAGDAKATVYLRRDDLAKKAGVSTGTSCTDTNDNFWYYSNVWVYTATAAPTTFPTESPTAYPTTNPTDSPPAYPTDSPTAYPTANPTAHPTAYPTSSPTGILAHGPCKFTSCTYKSGETFVKYSVFVPEKWHCEKSGSGCKCVCDDSLRCALRHHHTSGYKKTFEHC
jgi:hypothetical protein